MLDKRSAAEVEAGVGEGAETELEGALVTLAGYETKT